MTSRAPVELNDADHIGWSRKIVQGFMFLIQKINGRSPQSIVCRDCKIVSWRLTGLHGRLCLVIGKVEQV